MFSLKPQEEEVRQNATMPIVPNLDCYGLWLANIIYTKKKSNQDVQHLRSFLASVFFVVQLSTLLLLVPSCSADSISSSSTTYRYIDHHKRHFHKDHQSETSIISSKELYRKDISTATPTIGNDGIQEQYIKSSVNEETSASKQVVAASVNTQNFSNQESSTTITSKNHILRVHRRLDVEDIFNEMARKDPSQWSAVDWIVLVMFLTILCWVIVAYVHYVVVAEVEEVEVVDLRC